jgi:alkylated DNA nucleotide flippase Atl1
VVNSKGCISVSGPSAEEQRQRLLAEGVSIRGLRIAPQHRLA